MVPSPTPGSRQVQVQVAWDPPVLRLPAPLRALPSLFSTPDVSGTRSHRDPCSGVWGTRREAGGTNKELRGRFRAVLVMGKCNGMGGAAGASGGTLPAGSPAPTPAEGG